MANISARPAENQHPETHILSDSRGIKKKPRARYSHNSEARKIKGWPWMETSAAALFVSNFPGLRYTNASSPTEFLWFTSGRASIPS